MQHHLEQLIDLIPEGERPTAEHLEIITTLDETIKGRRIELQRWLKKLEKKGRDGAWTIGNAGSGKQYSDVELNYQKFIGKKRTKNMPGFEAEHQQRIADVRNSLPTVVIEDGGLKSEERIREKLKQEKALKEPLKISDFSRIRIVAEELRELERIAINLITRFEGKYHPLGYFNYYNGRRTKYDTPFRGLNTYWVNLEPKHGVNMSTEIQLVTQRVRAVLDLNHPFDVAQKISYPSEEAHSWLHRVLYKASIADFEEMLEET